MVTRAKLILVVDVRLEHDVVLARQRSRQIADLLGFSPQDQSRISTAVSEIARNTYNYAGRGKIEFSVDPERQQSFIITVRDRGPGIRNLDDILEGRYVSHTGLGLGIIGAKRLMDNFDIQSRPGEGTTIVLTKRLPPGKQVTSDTLARIADELARAIPQNPLEEVQQQNRELLRALEELRERQAELARLNRELEDTNRGVVALYAELDERADYLQRANELKTKFISNMSHEFRTPLNAILSLSRLLIGRTDGDLKPEQEKQVTFIRKSAEDLSELVNDLLDLAKVEAGKTVVRPREFDVAALFSALRGMLRPMLVGNSLDLVFETPVGLPPMNTDESKVSQVLRNFISNAIKYTEKGEVRVSAKLTPDGRNVMFAVADTGIGIADEDQERIFQEWVQIESPIQKKVKGTGLGLPLSRKLAQLLGGDVGVKSKLGEGSTFYASIPLVYRGASEVKFADDTVPELLPGKTPVLVVEDNRETLLVYETYFRDTPFQMIPATRLGQARRMLQRIRPVAVLLDILLHDESGWTLLTEMKSNAATRDIPVMVATVVDNRRKAQALGADDFCVKPVERDWLLSRLTRHTAANPSDSILIIDDDEVSRYLLKGLLPPGPWNVVEASGGVEGLRIAQEQRPRVIFLDLIMPELSGYEVLSKLREQPATASIPVILNTSKTLNAQESELLGSDVAAILSKESPSREAAIAAVRDAMAKAGVSLEQGEAEHV